VAAIRRDGGCAVTLHRKLAIATAAMAAALSLGGCATAIPGSPEEQLWFDKAVGYEIQNIPPDARLAGAIGYPRTDGPGFRPPPGFAWR
jgi:hypothetical protein